MLRVYLLSLLLLSGAGPEVRGDDDGDDPAAAAEDFLARRLPLGETPASFPLFERYQAASEAMRRMPRHRAGSVRLPALGAAATPPGVWEPVGPGNLGGRTRALVVDPANRLVLYAGTGEGFFNADAVRGAGLFKTADGGLHRQRQTATATSDFHAVNDLLPSARTRTLYAATGTGVWRSGDTGLTWRRILDPRVQGGLP